MLLLDAALLALQRIIVEGRCFQEVLDGGVCCITSARGSCLGYADARFGVRLNLAGVVIDGKLVENGPLLDIDSDEFDRQMRGRILSGRGETSAAPGRVFSSVELLNGVSVALLGAAEQVVRTDDNKLMQRDVPGDVEKEGAALLALSP